MKINNKRDRKLGGPEIIIQIDENKLNFKCNSYRGRSLENKAGCFCIVEYFANIDRVWTQVIPDKKKIIF